MDATVRMGARCIVHPFATLGGTPFSYRSDTRPLQRKPVNAGLIIGDDVEIMSHANVDLGTERDTVVGDGCRIDRFVHVAHDSILGRHCILAAGTIAGGFVELGDDVYCGINVSIKPRVKIGAGAKIGAGSVVLNDVPSGEIWVGNPARFLRAR